MGLWAITRMSNISDNTPFSSFVLKFVFLLWVETEQNAVFLSQPATALHKLPFNRLLMRVFTRHLVGYSFEFSVHPVKM